MINPLQTDDTGIQRRRWIVRGRVQGVGYRLFCVRSARATGIRGWARNLPDGTVEVLAEGRAMQLAALLERLRTGPAGALVSGVEATPADTTERLDGFEVRY